MKEIKAHELEHGEIFLQYYKSADHKDLFIGKFVDNKRYQWITCEIMYHYCSKRDNKKYEVLKEHEHYMDENSIGTLANRSTYFGEVVIFRLTDQELGSLAMDQI